MERRFDPAARMYRIARSGLLMQLREHRRTMARSAFPQLYACAIKPLKRQLVILRETFEESEPSRVANEYCEQAFYKAMEPYEDGILTPNGREVF